MLTTHAGAKGGLLLFRLAFTVTVLLGCLIASSARGEMYYGQVVTDETGKPLEGAVLTVIWYRAPLVYMDLVRRFQSAQETLTDADGKFSLEAAPGIDWNPFTYVLKEPDVVIFKPGYGPLADGFMRKTNALMPTMALRHGAVVKLPKLKTREEEIEFLSAVATTGIPRKYLPVLTRLINIQRQSLGLKPIW